MEIEENAFTREFGGPASFYRLLATREKSNKSFLARNFRQQKTRPAPFLLQVKILSFSAPSLGKLYFGLVSANLDADEPEHLTVHDAKFFTVEKGQDVVTTLQLQISKSLRSSKAVRYRRLRYMLVVNCCSLNRDQAPSSSESTQETLAIIETTFRCIFSTKKSPSTSQDSQNIALGILELFPRSISQNSIHSALDIPEIKIDSICSSARRHMAAQSSSPQTLSLQSTLNSDRKSNRSKTQPKAELTINLEVAWVTLAGQKRTTREHSDGAYKVGARVDLESTCFSSSKEGKSQSSTDHIQPPRSKPGVAESHSENSPYGIFLHYIYSQDGALSEKSLSPVVEFRRRLTCPWCNFTPAHRDASLCFSEGNSNSTSSASSEWDKSTKRAVSALVLHLQATHFHFEYETLQDLLGNLHVVIRRDRTHDASDQSIVQERSQKFEMLSSRRAELYIFQVPKVHLPADGTGSVMIQLPGSRRPVELKGKAGRESLGGKRGAKESGGVVGDCSGSVQGSQRHRAPGEERQYYNARLGLPLVKEELDLDSDDEVDTAGELFMAHRALEEFEDVSYEEKEFMKLWNSHVHSFPPYSDAYFPLVSQRFVTRFADDILRKELRHNFVLHLTNMWDFGLLRAEDIQSCLTLLDTHAARRADADTAAPSAAARQATLVSKPATSSLPGASNCDSIVAYDTAETAESPSSQNGNKKRLRTASTDPHGKSKDSSSASANGLNGKVKCGGSVAADWDR